MPLTKIQSLGITDGTIVNADINASAAIANTKLSAGAVLQVVQTTKTDFFSTSSSSFVDITGASVSITPSSASNKILLLISGQYSGTDDSIGHIKVLRDSTDIALGDSRGSTTRATTSAGLRTGGGQSNAVSRAFVSNILDSPATTSAITYKLQIISLNAQSVSIGGAFVDTNNFRGSYPTFLTAMEIKG